jgi:hypothetical protein
MDRGGGVVHRGMLRTSFEERLSGRDFSLFSWDCRRWSGGLCRLRRRRVAGTGVNDSNSGQVS